MFKSTRVYEAGEEDLNTYTSPGFCKTLFMKNTKNSPPIKKSNYFYLLVIKAPSGASVFTGKQIAIVYTENEIFQRYCFNDNWGEWEKMITESNPDYIALRKNSIKSYVINVGGSDQMFYPLVINADPYNINQVTLVANRAPDGNYRKSKAMWMISSDGWGASFQIRKLKYYKIGSIDTSKIISKVGGLVNAGFGWFVIWVRGQGVYDLTTDITKIESPVVYYEKKNLQAEEYPFYVEPTDHIEDNTYNSDVDNL